MMRIYLLAVFLIIIFLVSGCGETIHGVAKDTGRVAKGVKTIFFREKNTK